MSSQLSEQKADFDQLMEFSKKGKLYSLIFESSDDAIKTKTLDGTITSWNRGCEKIYGYLASEVIGKNINLIIPVQSEDEFNDLLKQVGKGQVFSNYETRRIRKDKTVIDVSLALSPIKNDAGKVIGIATISKDITEIKKNQEERNIFFNLSNDLICSVGGNGYFKVVNPAFEKILGYTKSELLAQPFINFVHPNDQKATLKVNENRLKGIETSHFINRYCCKNGMYKLIEWSITTKGDTRYAIGKYIPSQKNDELVTANRELAFQDEEKGKRAAELLIANRELAFQDEEKGKRAAELLIANKELVFQNDEKEKRAAELVIANEELAFQKDEKEKRAAELRIANYARSLIEASLDPLFTINTEGKITDMNLASVNMIGRSKAELLSTNFYNYFTQPSKAKKVYKEVFAKGFVVNYPLTIKDHHLTDVLFNGSVYKNEEGITEGAVVVARDITEQKRIETELKEAKVYAELATEIAEVAKAKAETATGIAENAVKAKQQFLSNMSHEIRTPMNAIIGFTKVVLKTELNDKQKEYLSAIKLSGDALIALINDILDLAKVESGKMTFEEIPFKLSESIHSMVYLFDLKIQEKNLNFLIDFDDKIPEVLIGDPMRLNQILLNLISNATKFTLKGNITIEVKLLKENDQMVSVAFIIMDTGIGIEEEKIGKIFENFQQAYRGSPRLYGGTGLGLAIVKQLIETQGGSISVKSELNVGSSFSFILPFKKTHLRTEPPLEYFDFDQEVQRIKILVAEDVKLNQLLMKTLLEDFGFESDIVSNGKLAIEKLANKKYDLILMDLQMPEMNGFEATVYIRKVMKSNIPIIALTADVTTVDVEKCRAIGMDDYISKPVDEKTLYSKILNFVKKAKAETTPKTIETDLVEQIEYIDLAVLAKRTKSDPKLMTEMISLYLEQTPPLIKAIKKSFEEKDWKMLSAAIHKMIPSFSIMGIHRDYELLAKKIQEFAETQQFTKEISNMVLQLEKTCFQVCKELEKELKLLNKK